MVVATATGYDVAYSVFTPTRASFAHFTSTDRNGTPQIPTVLGVSGAGSYTFALGSLGGTPAVGWSPRQGGGAKFDSAYAGPPFSTTTKIDLDRGVAQLSGGDGDGDGTVMVMILEGDVLTFDGATAGSVNLAGQTPVAIAWTGDSYEIAATTSDGLGVGLSEVRLARDRAIVSTRPLFADSVRGDVTGDDARAFAATVAADARRVLFGFFYPVAGVGHQVLTQVCR
jgi:hypothetical protein